MSIRIIILRVFILALLFYNIIRGVFYFNGLRFKNAILDGSTIEVTYMIGALLAPIFAFLMLGIVIHFIYYKKEISNWELGIASLLIIFELIIIAKAMIYSF